MANLSGCLLPGTKRAAAATTGNRNSASLLRWLSCGAEICDRKFSKPAGRSGIQKHRLAHHRGANGVLSAHLRNERTELIWTQELDSSTTCKTARRWSNSRLALVGNQKTSFRSHDTLTACAQSAKALAQSVVDCSRSDSNRASACCEVL